LESSSPTNKEGTITAAKYSSSPITTPIRIKGVFNGRDINNIIEEVDINRLASGKSVQKGRFSKESRKQKSQRDFDQSVDILALALETAGIKADKLLGVTFYDEYDTAGHVLNTLSDGLDKYYAGQGRGLIMAVGPIAGGAAGEKAMQVLIEEAAQGRYKDVDYLIIQVDKSTGKGNSVRWMFGVADRLKVKAMLHVDADLWTMYKGQPSQEQSIDWPKLSIKDIEEMEAEDEIKGISPRWVKELLEPALDTKINEGNDKVFVLPYYTRSIYDATITKFLMRIWSEVFYRRRIQQPIGGDFGFSIELVRTILDKESLWEDQNFLRFGYDNVATWISVATGATLFETALGEKLHKESARMRKEYLTDEQVEELIKAKILIKRNGSYIFAIDNQDALRERIFAYSEEQKRIDCHTALGNLPPFEEITIEGGKVILEVDNLRIMFEQVLMSAYRALEMNAGFIQDNLNQEIEGVGQLGPEELRLKLPPELDLNFDVVYDKFKKGYLRYKSFIREVLGKEIAQQIDVQADEKNKDNFKISEDLYARIFVITISMIEKYKEYRLRDFVEVFECLWRARVASFIKDIKDYEQKQEKINLRTAYFNTVQKAARHVNKQIEVVEQAWRSKDNHTTQERLINHINGNGSSSISSSPLVLGSLVNTFSSSRLSPTDTTLALADSAHLRLTGRAPPISIRFFAERSSIITKFEYGFDENKSKKGLKKLSISSKFKSSSPINYDVTPAEYQAQLDRNFAAKDIQAKIKLESSRANLNQIMKKNEIAFLPVSWGSFEHSIFISVNLSHSRTLRNYAAGIQAEVLHILRHIDKIRLNDLSKLHATLVNNIIGDNTIDISNNAMRAIYQQYRETIEGLGSFEFEIYGPHLMPNLGIVLEAKTYTPHLKIFRKEAQEILDKTTPQEDVRSSVSDIIHISLGYIVVAQSQELRRIYRLLEQARRNVLPFPVKVDKIQIVKTINKTMLDDGEIAVRLTSSPVVGSLVTAITYQDVLNEQINGLKNHYSTAPPVITSSPVSNDNNLTSALEYFIEKLGLSKFDVIHIKGLYYKFISPKVKTVLKIAENFFPSALLTEQERKEQLGAIDYNEIASDVANINAAKGVVITFNPMDGGLGTGVARNRYLAETIKRAVEPVSGKIKLGAKATDLFLDVTLKGKDASGNSKDFAEKLSIAEIKLLRAIKDASQFNSAVFQPLVNSDSAPSYIKFLNSIYLEDRIDDAKIQKRTYWQVMKEHNLNLIPGEEMLYQADLPIIDLENNNSLTDKYKAPGGHGQWGVRLLYGALQFTPSTTKDISIRAFYNGDGIANFPDAAIIGWMARNKVAIVMISTTKAGLDRKGGQIGIEKLPDGAVKVQMLELAQAKKPGKDHENLFYAIGLKGLDKVRVKDNVYINVPETQFFNTNIAIINYNVLTPVLQELSLLKNVEVDSELLSGNDLVERIITPDLIENVKDKDDGKKYTQLEGAIGSALLNLNAFFATTKDMRVKRILENNGIDKLLRIVNVVTPQRTRFFTPVKNAFDFWLQSSSDYYILDTEKWTLVNSQAGLVPPTVEITDSFYNEVQNVIDAFGKASTKGLKSLTIKGKVYLKDALLKGNVEIISEYQDIFDLNSVQGREQLDQRGVQQLILENVRIEINKEGVIIVARQSSSPVVGSLVGIVGASSPVDSAESLIEEKKSRLDESIKNYMKSKDMEYREEAVVGKPLFIPNLIRSLIIPSKEIDWDNLAAGKEFVWLPSKDLKYEFKIPTMSGWIENKQLNVEITHNLPSGPYRLSSEPIKNEAVAVLDIFFSEILRNSGKVLSGIVKKTVEDLSLLNLTVKETLLDPKSQKIAIEIANGGLKSKVVVEQIKIKYAKRIKEERIQNQK
ncbi:MAG: UTP--glucose-1-phosphate uridylyltransferase, partial [Candidatus Omnitrophica bacterium]|nr:UTP--glucose-1-phosphate uridylyltransferase [Candidatus Omnitrophota bacterium]